MKKKEPSRTNERIELGDTIGDRAYDRAKTSLMDIVIILMTPFILIAIALAWAWALSGFFH